MEMGKLRKLMFVVYTKYGNCCLMFGLLLDGMILLLEHQFTVNISGMKLDVYLYIGTIEYI